MRLILSENTKGHICMIAGTSLAMKVYIFGQNSDIGDLI